MRSAVPAGGWLVCSRGPTAPVVRERSPRTTWGLVVMAARMTLIRRRRTGLCESSSRGFRSPTPKLEERTFWRIVSPVA